VARIPATDVCKDLAALWNALNPFQQKQFYKHGISQQTFYRWKAKYGGLEVSEAQRLRQLEDENRKLKQLVAEQALVAVEAIQTIVRAEPQEPMVVLQHVVDAASRESLFRRKASEAEVLRVYYG